MTEDAATRAITRATVAALLLALLLAVLVTGALVSGGSEMVSAVGLLAYADAVFLLALGVGADAAELSGGRKSATAWDAQGDRIGN